MAFHVRCGERVTLLNNNCTAVRNFSEFNHGLVLSADPLTDDVLFEVRIDKKINSWSGSIEIGVTAANPDTLEFPACATKLRNGSWIMSGVSVLKDGTFVVEFYGSDLEKLLEGDRVGVMRTSQGELVFYINGESQGVAANDLPSEVHAVIDMYGKCVQVSLTTGANITEHNNDANVFLSPPLTVTNTVTQISSFPAPGCSLNDKLRFHTRCGSLVKLSANCRTAERRRPLDEFNNGVVMTHRCLRDNELFEIRIDRLVDKWSGSIEVGVTAHNPAALQFPATMTNMRSGTIMMSGCGILTNGKGTRREYGEFNLDELRVGDRVGMVRDTEGDLHYYINGLDQGIASNQVSGPLWGVIDLYGMTIKVTIVDRDEREQQNLVTRRNTLLGASGDCTYGNSAIETWSTNDTDRLLFHPSCGTHADVINNGRTAHRPNASDDFNNGVVLTQRILRINELFEVRLEKIVSKWAGSIEIGVTVHSPMDLEFPFTMTNVRSGTWMMTGNGVMHNGTTTIEQYGQNLDRLQVGDRVGVVLREGGVIHFCVNGVDQGPAATDVPEQVYGVIDLYGQAAQASILESGECGSPDTINSSVSNVTLYSDIRFHSIHGRNARISANGLTACRPRAFAEFNDAIIFSNRTLRDGEMFEITLDTIVERWCGSVELGVTAVRPDDISLPHTATDLEQDTVMLSGSTIMENTNNLGSNYPMDLDNLQAGVKIGVMRHPNNFIHFYLDGVDQGPACEFRHPHLYAVVDLYGQCTQVTIVPPEARAPYALSENSASLQATSVIQPILHSDVQHRFSVNCGRNIILSDGYTSARRKEGSLGTHHCLLFSSAPLCTHEPFEIKVTSTTNHIAGCLKIGITDINLNNEYIKNNLPGMIKNIPSNVWYAAANEIRYNNMLVGHMAPSLLWLRSGDRVGLELTPARTVKLLINSEDIGVTFNHVPETVWTVLELHGFVSSVQVTSLQGPRSPLRPSTLRLQDSLEFTLDHTNKHDSMLESLECDSPNYEFSEHHGKNIKLKTCKKVAKRIKSYNEGLIITNKPLSRGQCFMIRVDSVKENWSGSIVVGALSMSLEIMKNFILPPSAFSLKGSVWLAAWDYLNILGAKIKSSYGSALATCKVGTVITLSLSTTGALSITVGSTDLGVLATGLPQQVHIVVDVYGPCEKVSIVTSNSDRVDQQSIDNDDADPFSHTTLSTHIETNPEQIENNIELTANLHEKADLEQHEKESNSRSDTVTDPENPVPSSSNCQMNQSIRENNSTLTDSVSQNFLKNLEIKNASKLASSTDNENINIGIQRMESSMTESEPNPHSQNHVDNLNIQTRNSMDDISSFISETLQIQHNINLNIQRSQSSHSFTVINDSNAPSSTNIMDNNPIPPDTLNVTSSYSDVENGDISLQNQTEISSVSGDSNPLRSNISIENLIERDCSYLGCVTNFKHSLVLPEVFFASEEPICFCTECSDEDTSAYLSGWVRFKLSHNAASLSSDWWVAYYETKVDKIRAVLDHGQPLPTVCEIQGDSEKNERGGTKLILRETLEVRPQNTHHYNNMNVVYSISTAFEVRVRPGSISSSSSSEPQEWVTKESGACILDALLIKLVIT